MIDIDTMVHAARTAGEFLRGTNDATSTDKTNHKDFVTVADIKSQDILRNELQAAYPDVVILSEEDDASARAALFATDFTGFVLDPIDGTYNFKRDMRESAISVGYIEHGEPRLGVIYDPYKDELYSAVKGEGAYRNGSQIHVGSASSIKDASITTSNSYDDAAMARNLRRHLAIYEQSGMMPWTNCVGSGVLIMAYVACGRFDVYHHNGLKPWDNAAGFLLVREAGGLVQTLAGDEARFISPTVLMGNSKIVTIVREVFNTIDNELLM